MTSSEMQRPRFSATPYSDSHADSKNYISPLFSDGGTDWTAVSTCQAYVPPELFEVAVIQLVHHPEYNSTLILRSDLISDSQTSSDFPTCIPSLKGFRALRNIHRKLLPRRPGRDPSIEQYCTFYTDAIENRTAPTSCLVLSPILSEDTSMPYYHPSVRHIAFRYLTVSPLSSHKDATLELDGGAQIRIEVVPLFGAPDPRDVNSRLYRTCLALLEAVHRYCWGALTNYKKRMRHDCLVSREEYQDLYLVLRERYKHLVGEWQEATDPLKHVFEDIGIATYLMLLWKQNVGATADPVDAAERVELTRQEHDSEPWRLWPRPPSGFLDLGCGNGLLVHILVNEGYQGCGIDVRARMSWSHYPPETRAHLHVHAFDPLQFDISSTAQPPYLKRGTFIIANHADELTPWAPLLATLCDASGYLSIPCCAWTFDAKFERERLREYTNAFFPTSLPSRKSDNKDDEDVFVESLNLGGDAGSRSSSYSAYRVWLAKLSIHCGWEVECETLRIPSTRNWAIIGRKQLPGAEDTAEENCNAILDRVKERGIFKTRRPEGKAGDH